MTKVTVVDIRNKATIAQLEVSPSTTVLDLKRDICLEKPKFSPDRQKLTTGVDRTSPVLEDKKKVQDYQLTDGTIYLKDLGPQIAWKHVFLLEYLGPIIVWGFFSIQPGFIYGSTPGLTFYQKVAFACWMGHYLKREFETLFIHRFSHATMPLSNLFKNCSYYWFNTALIAYFVNHPLFTPPQEHYFHIGLALFVLCEIGNFITHVQLMNLRPAGSTERNIPRGFMFNLVSCPNYTFEILAWIGFSILTQTLTAYLFTIMGAAQMTDWALKKHRAYRKDFPDYPRHRKILIPFIF